MERFREGYRRGGRQPLRLTQDFVKLTGKSREKGQYQNDTNVYQKKIVLFIGWTAFVHRFNIFNRFKLFNVHDMEQFQSDKKNLHCKKAGISAILCNSILRPNFSLMDISYSKM